MTKTFYILLLLVFTITNINAQSSSVYGKITDEETGEELIYANIVLNKNGVFTAGGSTDFEGNYSIPVDPGVYELKVSYTGYIDHVITDVTVKGGSTTKLGIQLNQGTKNDSIFVHTCGPPLIGGHQTHKKTKLKPTSIYGKISDEETGEELIYANILLKEEGAFGKSTAGNTDFEGNYSILIEPGTYEMTVSYTGFPDRKISGIKIKPKEQTKFDIAMTSGAFHCILWVFHGYKIPLIELDNTTSGHTVTSEEIKKETSKDISQLILNTPGISINNF